jgi:SAM-dependent methyltransferase
MIRRVGEESSKTYQDKLNNGFFEKYMFGKGAEIGFAGYISGTVPILENCDGYDLNTVGYNGLHINVPDGYYDYLYSSHTLEHISDYKENIREWLRVVKSGGFIITVVPHRDLYEKKLTLPSRFNGDHKRFYTAASLLKEFEDSLPINSYRVRHLRENDEGHNYNDPPEKHGRHLYEIELVIQKL